MTSRPSTAAPILVVLAIGLVMLGAYVGGYFWLGEAFGYFVGNSDQPCEIERNYDYPWQQEIFQQAANVESWMRGMKVRAITRPIIRVNINGNVVVRQLDAPQWENTTRVRNRKRQAPWF
jgi:hypothetical protein